MAAFVLGNGISRRGLDVQRLLALAPVYGCNALYQEHTVTALVATDTPIATRIQQSGYSQQHRFYTRRPQQGSGALPVPARYHGFSSGPVAVAVALEDLCTPLYLVGFDLGANDQGRFNNVYAGQEFYKSVDSEATYTGNWVRQLLQITRDYPKSRFFRVCGDTTARVTELENLRNLQHLAWSEFLQRLNTPEEL